MVKRLYITCLLCLLGLTYACAETLLLRTGARVQGTIVFQNEEVVIIRDAEGARFQYPRLEIVEILPDDTPDHSASQNPETSKEAVVSTKKVSIALEVAGGASFIPHEAAGGAAGADLLIGSHQLAGRHILVGGGVGYHGLFLDSQKYNFLPIQVALRMPFMEAKHAPAFGASIGYGVALSKDYMGGIYAGVDFGYRCQVNPKTAVALSLFAQFQQANIATVETVEESEYTNQAGRNLITSGLKLALFF